MNHATGIESSVCSGRRVRRVLSSVIVVPALVGAVACSEEHFESAATQVPSVDKTHSNATTALGDVDVGHSRQPLVRADEFRGELATLAATVALTEAKLAAVGGPGAVEAFKRVEATLEELHAVLDDGLSADTEDARPAYVRLSRSAARLPVQVRRVKQALQRVGLDRSSQLGLFRALDSIKVASRSLGAAVAEAIAETGQARSAQLSTVAEAMPLGAIPLSSSNRWSILDEGHIDVIDVAYEDDALGLSIHDESVDPDVERDPSTTVLLVKGSAKLQVPDARFGFLGPEGADVWILPEGQPEAEAAGILWPGIATQEIEMGVFLDDQIDIRFKALLGPNGLSLFQSPQDELTVPTVLVDSEDGLPDTLTMPVGTHRHLNWAFEAPGIYLLKIQARGRLAEIAGNPWVNSENTLLKFVVLP
jgi:surface-anchored protein